MCAVVQYCAVVVCSLRSLFFCKCRKRTSRNMTLAFTTVTELFTAVGCSPCVLLTDIFLYRWQLEGNVLCHLWGNTYGHYRIYNASTPVVFVKHWIQQAYTVSHIVCYVLTNVSDKYVTTITSLKTKAPCCSRTFVRMHTVTVSILSATSLLFATVN